jgi:hypothetical protein
MIKNRNNEKRNASKPKEKLPKHQASKHQTEHSLRSYTKRPHRQFSPSPRPIQQLPNPSPSHPKHAQSAIQPPPLVHPLSNLRSRPIPTNLQTRREREILIPILKQVTMIHPFRFKLDVRSQSRKVLDDFFDAVDGARPDGCRT